MEKYIVGGAIRDSLLNIPMQERDWVVIGATPQEMINAGYKKVGKYFPVFLHPYNKEEYALARTERKSGNGYTGFTCYTSPEITLEEDLRRRDLTINAIACDKYGNFIDPYKGQQDIKKRLLRHVSEAFSEDPLRVLRVARFAAKFFHLNFTIVPETMFLMKKMLYELKFLSPERIWKETERALITNNPQIYFKVLKDCGALKILFPEIDALFYIKDKENKKNKNFNLGLHTLLTLTKVAQLSDDIAVRFSALCHDLGRSKYNTIFPSYYGHCTLGKKLIEILCNRIKVPNYICELAKIVAKNHELIHNVEKISIHKLINLFNTIDVWRKPERLEQVIIASEADASSYIYLKKFYYSQANFIREAYSIICSITNKEIIKDGFKGIDICKELYRRRNYILKKWKKFY